MSHRARAAALVVAVTVALGAPSARAQADEWHDDEDPPVLEGTVEGARPRPASLGDERSLDDAAMATATPEESLGALAGVGLVRAGGPLAPVRLRHRGLGGARLGSDLMGLRLDDPVTGGLDVAALPLWALSTASAAGTASPGGRAGLRFDGHKTDGFRARIGAGTLETLRLDATTRTSDPAGTVLAAGATAGTTKGDFRYAPATSSGAADGSPLLLRRNNDQRRAAGLLHGSTWLPFGVVSGLAWGSAHEGGVPGFSTAPTAGLRARHLVGGARAALVLERGLISAELDAAVRGSARSTWDEVRPTPEGLASLSTSAGVLLASERLLPGLLLQGSSRVEGASMSSTAFVRDVVDAEVSAEQRLFSRWLLLSARLGGTAFSDLGFLPRAEGVLELGPSSSWATGLRLAHGGRAPTLDEMYAPRGLVLGNADLAFERSSDAEIYLRLSSRHVDARVATFVGRMENAILFVNRNAFEVQPINTGPLLRAGLEGRVAVSPHRLLGLEVTASGLASRVDATGAALPVVPPLSSRIAARVGERGEGTVTVVMHQRAAVSNNLFGTLVTPGYVVVDVISRLPLGDVLAITAALTNALDVLDARDANLLPLPGRQLFVALEVRS